MSRGEVNTVIVMVKFTLHGVPTEDAEIFLEEGIMFSSAQEWAKVKGFEVTSVRTKKEADDE